jgi:hypothetical protein
MQSVRRDPLLNRSQNPGKPSLQNLNMTDSKVRVVSSNTLKAIAIGFVLGTSLGAIIGSLVFLVAPGLTMTATAIAVSTLICTITLIANVILSNKTKEAIKKVTNFKTRLQDNMSPEIQLPKNQIVPNNYCDPISHKLMSNPFRTNTGSRYDLSTLLSESDKFGIFKCPKTKLELNLTEFHPDRALQKEIQNWAKYIKADEEAEQKADQKAEQEANQKALQKLVKGWAQAKQMNGQLQAAPKNNQVVEEQAKQKTEGMDGQVAEETIIQSTVEKLEQLKQTKKIIQSTVEKLEQLKQTKNALKLQASSQNVPYNNQRPAQFLDQCGKLIHYPYKLPEKTIDGGDGLDGKRVFDLNTLIEKSDVFGNLEFQNNNKLYRYNLIDCTHDLEFEYKIKQWVKSNEEKVIEVQELKNKLTSKLSPKIKPPILEMPPLEFIDPTTREIMSNPYYATSYSGNKKRVVRVVSDLANLISRADEFGDFTLLRVDCSSLDIFNLADCEEAIELKNKIHNWVEEKHSQKRAQLFRIKLIANMSPDVLPLLRKCSNQRVYPPLKFVYSKSSPIILFSNPYVTPGGITHDLSSLLKLSDASNNFKCPRTNITYNLAECTFDKALHDEIHHWVKREIELPLIINELKPFIKRKEVTIPETYLDPSDDKIMNIPYKHSIGLTIDARNIKQQPMQENIDEELKCEIFAWAKDQLDELKGENPTRMLYAYYQDHALEDSSEYEMQDPVHATIMRNPYRTAGYKEGNKSFEGMVYDLATILEIYKKNNSEFFVCPFTNKKYKLSECFPAEDIKQKIDIWAKSQWEEIEIKIKKEKEIKEQFANFLDQLDENEAIEKPDDYIDPVYYLIMRNPYITPGFYDEESEKQIKGINYEFSTFEQNTKEGIFTCPISRKKYPIQECLPNEKLKQEIVKWAMDKKEEKVS